VTSRTNAVVGVELAVTVHVFASRPDSIAVQVPTGEARRPLGTWRARLPCRSHRSDGAIGTRGARRTWRTWRTCGAGGARIADKTLQTRFADRTRRTGRADLTLDSLRSRFTRGAIRAWLTLWPRRAGRSRGAFWSGKRAGRDVTPQGGDLRSHGAETFIDA